METVETLEQELALILKWEKNQKALFLWDKLGRLPFVMLDKVMPKAIKEKVGAALNEVGVYVQEGGKFLVQRHKIAELLETESVQAGYQMYGEVNGEADGMYSVEGLPLALLDKVANSLSESRSRFAAAQGAALGVGGIVTLAADIPMVMGLSLKVLQEMALCYGFDPNEPQERVFVVKCLQFCSADIVGKKAILEELADYDNPSKQVEVISQMKGWREVFEAYSESFGWKKLFQMIPVAGMIFGSVSNKSTIENVAEVGKLLYKKRLILRRMEGQ